MTIGIGASGPGAGLAVFRGLQAAEAVGRGSIRGFAVFAAIMPSGQLVYAETQRGGSRTLFIEAETTGIDPTPQIQLATAAAIISSGPERPLPLRQFLAGEAQVGLVSGHRMPNRPGTSGMALNAETLSLMAQGLPAATSVQKVLAANPDADVGLIAIDLQGGIYAQNSHRVSQRPDVGQASRIHPTTQSQVSVLHNAIDPTPSLADLVADIAIAEMGPPPIAGWITVPANIPVIYGPENRVSVNEDGMAYEIMTTDLQLTQGRQLGSAIYLHSYVQTADQVLGKTLVEPFCTVQDGILTEMSGQTTLRISYTQ